jgi:hypothetical protein
MIWLSRQTYENTRPVRPERVENRAIRETASRPLRGAVR